MPPNHATLMRRLKLKPIRMRILFAAAIAFSSAIFAPQILRAAEPDWPTTSYEYVVVNQDLRTVLQQFGINTGLRIILSDSVQGRVHGRLPPALPKQFLERLAQTFGLDWYYDGAAIAVSARSEAQTSLITLGSASFSHLQSALDSAKLLDQRYPLRPAAENGAAIASGPPRYLAIVRQMAETLSPVQPHRQTPPARQDVMIIRGSSISRVEFP